MTKLDFRGIYEPTEEFLKLKEENLKLKQKLEAIRTTIVDIFDKNTKEDDAHLYYDALIEIERTIRECGK